MADVKRKTLREILLGWGAKILLALLILSFGVWGIGDYVAPTQGNNIVATVGEKEIPLSTLQNEVQFQVSKLQRILGTNFTLQKAKAMGVIDSVLQSLIQKEVFAESAKKMGLVISDELVSREIKNDQQFKSSNGEFDRIRFDEAMQRAGLNEQSYIQMYKSQLLQGQFLSILEAAQFVPLPLLKSIYKYRNEKRSARLIAIKHSKIISAADVNETSLRKYYNKNQARFTAPEFRSVTLVKLTIDDIIDEINVTKTEIQNSYNERINEFQVPEKRQIEQIIVSSESQSKLISKKLKGGGSFYKLAKDIAGLDKSDTALGILSKKEIPIEGLSNAIFALDTNIASTPIKTELGWHILRVTKIFQKQKKALSEVKSLIRREIATEKAIDNLYHLSTKFEDELGGGASIEEAAKKFDFKFYKIPSLDANGMDISGQKVKLLTQPVVQVAFNTQKGQDSALTELGDNGYFILHVENITPPTLRSFDTVRAEVKKALQKKERAKIAEKKAKVILKRLQKGVSMNEIAKELDVRIKVTSSFLRTGVGLKEILPGGLVNSLFKASKNEFVSAASDKITYVARIESITPADVYTNKLALDTLEKQLQENFIGDSTHQYSDALRSKLGVKIDRTVIAEAF